MDTLVSLSAVFRAFAQLSCGLAVIQSRAECNNRNSVCPSVSVSQLFL